MSRLHRSRDRLQLKRTVATYDRGDISLGRAAEETGLTVWELIDMVRAAGVGYPLRRAQLDRRLAELGRG
jgi:predicted HTH domain antitoxin